MAGRPGSPVSTALAGSAGFQISAPNRASAHPRQREYPQPPPPSKNSTTRTINTVSIVVPHLIRGSWTDRCNGHLISSLLHYTSWYKCRRRVSEHIGPLLSARFAQRVILDSEYSRCDFVGSFRFAICPLSMDAIVVEVARSWRYHWGRRR